MSHKQLDIDSHVRFVKFDMTAQSCVRCYKSEECGLYEEVPNISPTVIWTLSSKRRLKEEIGRAVRRQTKQNLRYHLKYYLQQ